MADPIETPKPNEAPKPIEAPKPVNVITEEPPATPVRVRAKKEEVLDLSPVIEAVNGIDKKVTDFIEGQKTKPKKEVGVLEDLDQLMGFET